MKANYKLVNCGFKTAGMFSTLIRCFISLILFCLVPTILFAASPITLSSTVLQADPVALKSQGICEFTVTEGGFWDVKLPKTSNALVPVCSDPDVLVKEITPAANQGDKTVVHHYQVILFARNRIGVRHDEITIRARNGSLPTAMGCPLGTVALLWEVVGQVDPSPAVAGFGIVTNGSVHKVHVALTASDARVFANVRVSCPPYLSAQLMPGETLNGGKIIRHCEITLGPHMSLGQIGSNVLLTLSDGLSLNIPVTAEAVASTDTRAMYDPQSPRSLGTHETIDQITSELLALWQSATQTNANAVQRQNHSVVTGGYSYSRLRGLEVSEPDTSASFVDNSS